MKFTFYQPIVGRDGAFRSASKSYPGPLLQLYGDMKTTVRCNAMTYRVLQLPYWLLSETQYERLDLSDQGTILDESCIAQSQAVFQRICGLTGYWPLSSMRHV